MSDFINDFIKGDWSGWNKSFYPSFKPHNEQLEIYVSGEKHKFTANEKKALEAELNARRERAKKLQAEQANPTIEIKNHTGEGNTTTYPLPLESILGNDDKKFKNNKEAYNNPFELFKIDLGGLTPRELDNTMRDVLLALHKQGADLGQLNPKTLRVAKLCYIAKGEKKVKVCIMDKSIVLVLKEKFRLSYGLDLDFQSTQAITDETLFEDDGMLIRRIGDVYRLKFPYDEELKDRVKALKGSSWDNDKKVWQVDVTAEAEAVIKEVIDQMSPLPGVAPSHAFEALEGEPCETPVYPTSWNHLKSEYVAIIDDDGEREFVSEAYDHSSSGKNAKLRVDEHNQPENLPLGTIIEVKQGSYKSPIRRIYRKDADGWKLLGENLNKVIRQGLAIVREQQSKKFEQDEFERLMDLFKSTESREMAQRVFFQR